MKKIVIAFLSLAVIACMTACGSSDSGSKADAEPKEEEEQEPEYKALGTEADDALKMLVTNATGSDIKAVTVKNTADKSQTDMLSSGDVFTNEETREMFFAPQADAKYTVIVTLADDTQFKLHNFPMEDALELKVERDAEYGYLEYKSAAGEDVNTLESEKRIKAKAIARAKAKKEAEAKAKAEAEAAAAEAERQAQEAAAAAAAAQQQQQAAPAPSYSGGGGGGDTGCLGGGGLTY